VKRYAELRPQMAKAVAAYCKDVREGAFPAAEHSFAEAAAKQ
jgi:3-methyl-2-oxobutanoate hydroxymethyltransferase